MPYCPDCGAETETGATRCSDCGASLPAGDDHATAAGGWRDVVAGFVAGVVALVAGFAAMAALSDARENRELVEQLLPSDGPAGVAVSQLLPEWYQALGWVFLENHQVDVSVSINDTFGDAGWVSEYAETLLPSASELQFLPPLLLAVAGALVALRRPRESPVSAARAGAFVVAGYLPGIAVLASVAAFEVVILGDIVIVEIAPDVGQAILVAGVVYPLAFGAGGGALAFLARRAVP